MALRVWLPLIEDFTNQGISNLTPTLTSGNAFTTPGKIGNKSLHLTKLQTILPNSSASCMCGAKQLSYAYWVKVNTAWSTNWLDGIRWIETDGSATATARQEFYTNCTLIGTWYKGGSISGKTLTPGEWTHLAATFDYTTGEVKFYINGVLTSTTTNLDTTYHCRGDFYIGDNGVDIQENDVRIYDHCLSAAEVREIAQGLVLHYKLDKVPVTITNAYGTPYFDANAAGGGWNHWGRNGAVGSQGINTNAQYMYYKDKTRNHYVTNGTDATGEYLVYQSPAFEGGYRSLQCIVKETNSTPITESILFPAWNNRDGGAPGHIWTHVMSLGDGFYLCQVDGVHQDGNNDLIGFYICPGYTIYFSAAWCENDREVCSDVLFSTDIIEDSSGYNHNGTLTGAVAITSETPRYNVSTHFSANNQYIHVSDLTTSGFGSTYTFAWWEKRATYSNTMAWGFQNGIRLNGLYNGNLWNTGDSSNNPLYKPGTTTAVTVPTVNVWHHFAMVADGSTCKVYQDGELWAQAKTFKQISGTSLYINGWDSGTSYKSTNMSVSDFRLYATPLLDTDIKQLYNVGMKVDKSSKIHTFEVFENNQNKITKQGQLKCANIIEFNGLSYLKYDSNLYIEPDGSCWVRIYHHNNPGAGSFASTNDFAHSVYIDDNRWFNVEVCNYLDKWEFMVKGQFTNNSDPWKLRWIQTVNPMTAAFADVAAANITKITGNGYSDYPSAWGGLYAKKGSAYLTTNNGNSGNWWGAVGSYSVYQNGIPGWGPSVTITTTGFNDLYVRIDNLSTTFPLNVKSTKNNLWLTSNIIER